MCYTLYSSYGLAKNVYFAKCTCVSVLFSFIVSVANRWRPEPKECVVGGDSVGHIYRKQVHLFPCCQHKI